MLHSGSVEAIERHTEALRSTISQADELKRALEALKIEAEEDLGDIGTWNTAIDLQLMKAVEALPFTAEGYNRAKSILLSNYGKESEITKAFVKEVMALPVITRANPRRISKFSKKLTYCVQALETMNKLSEVNGNVPMTLDKLPAIRGDLVRTDPDWEKCNFAQLSEAVRLWTKRNAIEERETPEQPNSKRDRSRKLFQARGGDGKPNKCVYCGDVTHRSSECRKISTVNEQKQFLARKQLFQLCNTESPRHGVFQQEDMLTLSQMSSLFDM